MTEPMNDNPFYPPNGRELGLAGCCVLERAGGRLSSDRTVEVLCDFLEIPEGIGNAVRPETPQYTQLSYYFAWSCSELRKKGFMARNQGDTWGECILTEAGHELGRWARRIYDGERPEIPDWVGAFLRPTFGRMRNLLKGGKRAKPPDYELCRWVRYCYLLNEPALGAAIFNLILPEHVESRLFKQAERQARILKLNASNGEAAPEHGVVASSVRALGRSAENGFDEIRELIAGLTPPGSSIRSPIREVYNQVREIGDDGIKVVSSKSGRERVVPWRVIQAAQELLESDGAIEPSQVAGHGTFVCSLLAQLPDTRLIRSDTGVRLVKLRDDGEDGEE